MCKRLIKLGAALRAKKFQALRLTHQVVGIGHYVSNGKFWALSRPVF